MKISENQIYEAANSYVATSWQKWEEGKHLASWAYTLPARLTYLASSIASLALLPFAIIAITFGTLYALSTWNRSAPVFQTSKTYIMQKANHFFISFGGSLISPALAHKYRDFNITPYIVAVRITVITGGILYWALVT